MAIFLARVVCVGGDGMFSEILHGLIIRTQTDHRVDRDRPDSELVPCSLRVGIIPAGGSAAPSYQPDSDRGFLLLEGSFPSLFRNQARSFCRAPTDDPDCNRRCINKVELNRR